MFIATFKQSVERTAQNWVLARVSCVRNVFFWLYVHRNSVFIHCGAYCCWM